MLGKVKDWLGIEGVKLELVVPPDFKVTQGSLGGIVRLQSMRAQTVTAIRIDVVEKYTRGRDDNTLVDEYNLGTITLRDEIPVPAEGEAIEVPFVVPVEPMNSAVDEFGRRNLLFRGLAWAARKAHNAVSEYRIEAQAKVRGMGLDPHDTKPLG